MPDFERTYHEARELIQTWTDKQGHDRCWYYPELFERLKKLYDIRPRIDPALPPRAEFEEGCRRYQTEEYGPKHTP